MKPILLSNPSSYNIFAVRRRMMEIGWRIRNTLCPPAVWIAGEYFAENLGDWTMGQAFLNAEAQAGLTSYSGGQGSAPGLVMGGGEIGDVFHFERAIQMAGVPERVAVCGINPVYTFDKFPEHLLEKICRMPYLSVRSRAGAERMRSVLSRSDIELNPDPAFCFSPETTTADVPKRLGISLMTFYLSVQNRREFAPDQTLKSVVADPQFASQIDQAGMRYIKMMKDLIRQSLADGWEIINIPFSAVDAMFADTVLRSQKVRRIPFCRNPMKVLETIQTCRRFVAARFHAHIFGLMAQVPVVSIAYASKCTQLWKDLGLEPELQVSRMDICSDPQKCASRLAADAGVRLSGEKLRTLAQGARQSILNAMEAVI